MNRSSEYFAGPETSRLDSIVHALRLRICTADPGVEHLLHENKLAAEFGVSRTPIRHALQRLSYEHLVQTRSGVGTVVAPLDPASGPRDFDVLRGIIELAAATATRPVPTQPLFALRGLAMSLDAIALDSFTFAQHFDLRAALIPLLSALIEDPILAEAHAAAHWRMLRRSQGFGAAELAAQHAALSQAFAAIATQTDAGPVLSAFAATAARPAP
ncbi:GntR family transcriptional regulator [Rhodobacteraceae bacterium 2376]|uniref:GntR family transcriptional regulator n=1 Tax=Rhabdonatronobacter sediminivivens TaxID=2743469 RepID=A0A7Z0I014_9RHOB|nr:GntR family transcriptional regulator [Rhabdonatronobacter sediminivivens]NYS25438.1 GntR family transcriptional regulator [Rhabdonatronobacter sediminivivens]